MTSLIKRNSTIPKKETLTFTTDTTDSSQSPKTSAQSQNKISANDDAENGSSYVIIKVYEGERAMTKDNNLLGTFELTGISAAPPGLPQIDVTFDIDRKGIIIVSATDKATGKESKITITNDEGRLSTYEIEQMIKEAEEYRADEERQFLVTQAKNDLESFAHHTRSKMEELKSSFAHRTRSKMEELKSSFAHHMIRCKMEELKSTIEDTITKCQEVIDWVDITETADMEEYEEKQKVLEEMRAQAFKKLCDSHYIAGASDVKS